MVDKALLTQKHDISKIIKLIYDRQTQLEEKVDMMSVQPNEVQKLADLLRSIFLDDDVKKGRSFLMNTNLMLC